MSVFIQLEKSVFTPGETVKGSMMIDCVQPGEAVLNVTGVEETRFLSVTTTRQIFKEAKSVSQIAQGQYKIPFSFKLPTNIPSSIEIKYNSKTRAHVEYALYATIPGIEPKKANIWVKSKLQSKRDSMPVYTTELPMTGCCCSKKGNTSIKMALDKNIYVNGEELILKSTVSNNTSLTISVKIYVSLVIQLSRNTYSIGRSKRLLQVDESPTFPPFQTVSRENRIPVKIDDRWTSCPDGESIKVWYDVYLEIENDACCFCQSQETKNVSITFLIDTEVQNGVEVFQAPITNWSPQVLSEVSLNLSAYPFTLKGPEAAQIQENQVLQGSNGLAQQHHGGMISTPQPAPQMQVISDDLKF